MIYGIKKPPGAYKLSFHVASGNGQMGCHLLALGDSLQC